MRTLRHGIPLARVIPVVFVLACSACQPGSGSSASADPGAGARLAAMAPAAMEIVAALDAVDQVVAVGDFVTRPPAVETLPSLGSYDTPNIELILALAVDIFVTVESEAGTRAHERLRDLGVDVVDLPLDTFEGTLASITELGDVLGRSEQAGGLVEEIETRLAGIEDRLGEVPRRRVMVVVGNDPLYVAGPGSHLDELLERAGGTNIFHDTTGSYRMVSLEAAVERGPEVIIDLSDNRPGAERGISAGRWARWPFLPAVREGRVYQVDPIRLTIPGPRLPRMALLMARMIHPEVFGPVEASQLGPLERHAP